MPCIDTKKNMGWEYSQEESDLWQLAERGGEQGDYRKGIKQKINNAIECLKNEPLSKRATITFPFSEIGSEANDWTNQGMNKYEHNPKSLSTQNPRLASVRSEGAACFLHLDAHILSICPSMAADAAVNCTCIWRTANSSAQASCACRMPTCAQLWPGIWSVPAVWHDSSQRCMLSCFGRGIERCRAQFAMIADFRQKHPLLRHAAGACGHRAGCRGWRVCAVPPFPFSSSASLGLHAHIYSPPAYLTHHHLRERVAAHSTNRPCRGWPCLADTHWITNLCYDRTATSC